MIRELDIQLFNMCNKNCSFCLPYTDGRTDKVEYLDIDIVIKFIEDSIENGLLSKDSIISCHRFSEPTLRIDLIKKLFIEVNKISNTFKLRFLTNGTYNNKELLSFIEDMNLNDVYIDKIGVNFYEENTNIYTVIKYFSNFNIDLKTFKYSKERNHYLFKINNSLVISGFYDKTNMFNNKPELVSSRCGMNERYITKDRVNIPCSFPSYFMGIDSNGNVMPCCEYYSRNEGNEKYIIGNIYNNTIDEIKEIKELLGDYSFDDCIKCDSIMVNTIMKDIDK